MTIRGLIAHYGDAPGVDARALARGRAEARGVHVRNLSVGEYAADWHDTFLAEMTPWVTSGEVRYREYIREGLEIIPAAFCRDASRRELRQDLGPRRAGSDSHIATRMTSSRSSL